MKKSLGEGELGLLRYIAENQPVTVRDVAEGYGANAGLARTTVLTVMERLRAKGFLTREEGEGGFRYSATQEEGPILRNVVADFVRGKLRGSISPFAAYLAQADELTPEELAELRSAVDSLEKRQRDA
ncbi:MAG: BlaI/MecI/CopY family transcriptional regulator [Fimbriimonas sp.]